MTKGFFLTLEGGEGVGKSSQARKLQDYFTAQGKDCVLTREPGGSPVAEAIRNLIFADKAAHISAETELLLMFAARKDHIETVIAPALEAGKTVICDRYIDSSYVYQGAIGGVSEEKLDRLTADYVAPYLPDLCLLFDAPVEISAARLAQRHGADNNRNDLKSLEHAEILRRAYLARADVAPYMRVTEASGTETETFDKILKIINL